MKRKIIASLLVLAMAGSLLAGCGNKASDSGSSDSSKIQQIISIGAER